MPPYPIPNLSLTHTLKQHLEAFEKSCVTIFDDNSPEHQHIKAHLFLETLPPTIRNEVTSDILHFPLLPLKFTEVRTWFNIVAECMDADRRGERQPYHDLLQAWKGDRTGEGLTQENNTVATSPQRPPDTPTPPAASVAPRAPSPAPAPSQAAPSSLQAALDKARSILPPADQLAVDEAMTKAVSQLNALIDHWTTRPTLESSTNTTDAIVVAMTDRLSRTLDALHELSDEISIAQSSLDFGTSESESTSTGVSVVAVPTKTTASVSDKSESEVDVEDAITISTETGPLSSDSTDAELLPHWGPFKYLGTETVSPVKHRQRLTFIIDRRGAHHIVQSASLLQKPKPSPFALMFQCQPAGMGPTYLKTFGGLMISKPSRNNGKPPASPDGLIELANKVYACDQVPGFNILSRSKLVQAGWEVNYKTRVLIHWKSGITFPMQLVDGKDIIVATVWGGSG